MASYNAADYIDKATVLSACDKIDEYAKDYYKMAREIDMAADDFNKDVLSIEGESLDELIRENAIEIRNFESNINDLTAKIRISVNQAYDAKQEELNIKKAADEARARAEAEAAASKNN